MFPRNQYKDTITVFTPYRDTNLVRFFRTVLYRCFWSADSIAVARKGGTAAPEKVELHIPLVFNKGYINRNDWIPSTGQWTFRIGGDDTNRSVILQGDVSYPALEEWQNAEDLGREFLKFTREHGNALHFPCDVNELTFGPAGMWRIVVSC